MAENLIFEQSLEEFGPVTEFPGLYGQFVESPLFELVIGETYRVVWDGEEFLVEARDASPMGQMFDGWLYLGNGTPYDMPGNNEPFVIGFSSYGVQFFAYDEESAHNITIYHIVEDSGKIIILDRQGIPNEYEGIESVTFDTADGGTQMFTKGRAIEGIEIELDFSDDRDQPIYAPDGTLVKSAIIKKPVDLVPENIAQGVTIAGIEGIYQGGDDRVKHVTFMYGETELITYPVIVGDTVKDPVSVGLIEVPIKEPTESTIYSFGGWSLTDGGEVDSNALTNVTKDRTVYAAFTESTRVYIIRFFDGDTLLKIEQIAYGSSSSYIPEKEKAIFTKWEPEATNIAHDMDCYAQWLEGVDFRFDEWSKISEVARTGKADQMFNIGDTRTVTLTWEDGTTEDIELQIADMAIHNDRETQRPLVTLITKNLISKTSKWAINMANRNQYNYHSSGCQFRIFLTETVFPALPEDLRAVLRQGLNQFYIAPPHEHNIGFYYTTTPTVTTGQTYPIFTTNNATRIKTLNGVAHNWATYDNSNGNNAYRKTVVDANGVLRPWHVSTTEAEIGVCFLLFI